MFLGQKYRRENTPTWTSPACGWSPRSLRRCWRRTRRLPRLPGPQWCWWGSTRLPSARDRPRQWCQIWRWWQTWGGSAGRGRQTTQCGTPPVINKNKFSEYIYLETFTQNAIKHRMILNTLTSLYFYLTLHNNIASRVLNQNNNIEYIYKKITNVSWLQSFVNKY